MRHHEYTFKNTSVIHGEHVDFYIDIHKCIHCGKETTLDDWQIQEMPKSLAICTSSQAPEIGFFENLFSLGIDCLIKS